MTAARQLATYEDLFALPDESRAEIVRGEVVVAPAPLPRHSRVQRALASLLGKPFDDDDGAGGPGGWWILLDVDVRLGPHDVVRPDLVGWRRERLPAPWDQRPIDVVPDRVCEVPSPSNARHDRVTKARLYLEAGVPFYWVVDAETRVLEALMCDAPVRESTLRRDAPVREGARWVEAGRFSDGDVAGIPPFEAILLDVARVFPPPPQPPAP